MTDNGSCESVLAQVHSSYSSFSECDKILITAMAAVGAMMSPLSSQIYLPIIPGLAEHYHVTITQMNLSITTYLIVQGVVPSFLGTFADTGGRRPAYILCFTIYSAANLGLALQDSYASLMVLRAVQSAGSSATSSLGYGVVADIAHTSEKGRYMGLLNAGSMSALSLGPVLGGILVQWLGWRSIFWGLLILGAGYLLCYIILMPESSRSIVGNGSEPPASWWRRNGVQCISLLGQTSAGNHQQYHEPRQPLAQRPTLNPLRVFTIFQNMAASIAICHIGLVYALITALSTSTSNIFPQLYGLNAFKLSLCFFCCVVHLLIERFRPSGIAGCIGSVVTGLMLDLNCKRLARKLGQSAHNNDPHDNQLSYVVEKSRLQVAVPQLIVAIAMTIPYGWVLEQHMPLYAPLVMQGLLSFCSLGCIGALSTLLVDYFPNQPATASAASNLVRCWFTALVVAVLDHLLAGMGWGWCFLMLGVVLAAASPLLWVRYQKE